MISEPGVTMRPINARYSIGSNPAAEAKASANRRASSPFRVSSHQHNSSRPLSPRLVPSILSLMTEPFHPPTRICRRCSVSLGWWWSRVGLTVRLLLQSSSLTVRVSRGRRPPQTERRKTSLWPTICKRIVPAAAQHWRWQELYGGCQGKIRVATVWVSSWASSSGFPRASNTILF